jgi:hypothetical protein
MGFFDRQQTVAAPGYNRWLFPPAALAVHLSIGQVYAFSVFKLPLTKIIGVTKSAPDDWSQPSLAWIFSLAIFFSDFPRQCLGAGSNALDHARPCLPPLFVSAAALSFRLLASGGTNFGSSI